MTKIFEFATLICLICYQFRAEPDSTSYHHNNLCRVSSYKNCITNQFRYFGVMDRTRWSLLLLSNSFKVSPSVSHWWGGFLAVQKTLFLSTVAVKQQHQVSDNFGVDLFVCLIDYYILSFKIGCHGILFC